MIANNMMRQAGNRAAGINGELSCLGAPFLVQPVSTVKPNLGEIFGFAAKPLVEDGMAHPVVYWEPAFSKLTDRQLASMIIEKYL